MKRWRGRVFHISLALHKLICFIFATTTCNLSLHTLYSSWKLCILPWWAGPPWRGAPRRSSPGWGTWWAGRSRTGQQRSWPRAGPLHSLIQTKILLLGKIEISFTLSASLWMSLLINFCLAKLESRVAVVEELYCSIPRVPECLPHRRNWVQPAPSPASEYVSPLGPKGQEQHSLAGEGVGGPNSDD